MASFQDMLTQALGNGLNGAFNTFIPKQYQNDLVGNSTQAFGQNLGTRAGNYLNKFLPFGMGTGIGNSLGSLIGGGINNFIPTPFQYSPVGGMGTALTNTAGNYFNNLFNPPAGAGAGPGGYRAPSPVPPQLMGGAGGGQYPSMPGRNNLGLQGGQLQNPMVLTRPSPAGAGTPAGMNPGIYSPPINPRGAGAGYAEGGYAHSNEMRLSRYPGFRDMMDMAPYGEDYY